MKRYTAGFMMIEVIIVASIIGIAVISVMTVAQKSIYISRQSLHSLQASSLLEEGAEATRIARDTAWTNISSLTNATSYYPTFSGGTWTLSTTPSQVGIFTRSVSIASVMRNATTN